MYTIRMVDGIMHPTNIDDDILHYGVKGMKWGVRKQSESSGGGRKSGGSSNAKVNKNGAKRAAIAVAAIGGTALASYGAYKEVKSGSAANALRSAKIAVNNARNRRLYGDDIVRARSTSKSKSRTSTTSKAAYRAKRAINTAKAKHTYRDDVVRARSSKSALRKRVKETINKFMLETDPNRAQILMNKIKANARRQ